MATEYSLYGDQPFDLNAFTPTLKVTVTGHQSYSGITGNNPWMLRVYIDGTLINLIGGSGIGTETPVLVAVCKNLNAGTHYLRVTWQGHYYITFSGDTTCLEANYK